MHNTKPSPFIRRLGFTLIEVLVVITVIAILVGILVPVVGMAQRKAKSAAAINEIAQVEQALRAYLSDHNGPPTNNLDGIEEARFEDQAISINPAFAQLLMGENVNGDNSSRIRYMEFRKFSANGTPLNTFAREGIVDVPEEQKYYVKFDMNFDGVINAERRASAGGPKAHPSKAIRAPVIVWTFNGNIRQAGNDKLIDYNNPDSLISSWQQ